MKQQTVKNVPLDYWTAQRRNKCGEVPSKMNADAGVS